MLSLDDSPWDDLRGGYRVKFDPRPWLALLETGKDNGSVWQAFWEELHHQGDVGEASYATIPHLVAIYQRLRIIDCNVYDLVACIELCRGKGANPPVPKWLEEDYYGAIQQLAIYGLGQFPSIKQSEDVRAVLSVLALSKGARMHAKFLFLFADEELSEIESNI